MFCRYNKRKKLQVELKTYSIRHEKYDILATVFKICNPRTAVLYNPCTSNSIMKALDHTVYMSFSVFTFFFFAWIKCPFY